MPIRVIRPVGAAEVLPAVMYFHGGGWVLGDRETHDRLVREIAVGAEAAGTGHSIATLLTLTYPNPCRPLEGLRRSNGCETQKPAPSDPRVPLRYR